MAMLLATHAAPPPLLAQERGSKQTLSAVSANFGEPLLAQERGSKRGKDVVNGIAREAAPRAGARIETGLGTPNPMAGTRRSSRRSADRNWFFRNFMFNFFRPLLAQERGSKHG